MDVARKSESIGGSMGVGRDLNVGGNSTMQGSLAVGHNLTVEGMLEAKNIKACSKGLYQTLDNLKATYPDPRNGWWAFVGDTMPAELYVAYDGAWIDTGKKAGEDLAVDVAYFNKAIADIIADHDADVVKIETDHNADIAAIYQIIGTIDLADIDLTSDQVMAVAMNGTAATYYKVTYNGCTVGALTMFSDAMHHQVTQVLTTNATLNASGTFDASHTDNAIFTYRRNLGTSSTTCIQPGAEWSEWENQVADELGDNHYIAISQAAVNASITAVKKLITALETKHETDITAVKKSVTDLETKHNTEIAAVNKSVTDLETKHKTDKEALEKSIGDLTTTHNTDKAALEKSISDAATAHDKDVEDIWNYVAPLEATLSAAPAIIEAGVATNVTLSWKCTRKGEDVTAASTLTLDGEAVTGTSMAKAYSPTAAATYTPTLNATHEKLSATAKATIKAVLPSWWSVVAADWSGAVDTASMEKSLLASKAFTRNGIALTNQRMAFCYPASYGALASIKDGNGYEVLESYDRATASLTINGIAAQYYVYSLRQPVTATNVTQIYS